MQAQNYIYHGDKHYLATDVWSFQASALPYSLEVQIGKSPNGGVLKLAYNISPGYIGGMVYVFLADGSIIKCSDKGIKDAVDDKSVVLYYFTASEMEKLKLLNILKIRFTIKWPSGFVGSPSGDYNAENKRRTFSFDKDYSQTDMYQTANEISKLYN